jgi:hypothetical protein
VPQLLGGVDIFGGRGTIPGVVLAFFTLAVLGNVLRLANVSSDIQGIAVGLLLIVSVAIPTLARRVTEAIDRTQGRSMVLTSGGATVRRQVRLGVGTTAVLMAPTTAPAAPPQQPGWVRVESGVALDVYEDDRLIGTSAVDRIMLRAGSHALRLVSRPLNFERNQTVQIAGGQTRVVKPDLPNGTLSINALPWAEVLVNGERKGETPIGNLAVSIGQHEVVFRHPQFGEQRRSVTVTTGGITRVGVDLRR